MTILLYLVGIALVIGGVFCFITPKQKGKKEKVNAQEFTNVKDIKNGLIVTKDNYLHALVQINPISLELYSDRELMDKVNRLTSELTRERKPFKFCMIPKNVDVKPQIAWLNKLRQTTENEANKYFLLKSMEYLGEIATGKESNESMFFYVLWAPNTEAGKRELNKRVLEFVKYFERSGFSARQLEDKEVAQVLKYYAYPSLVYLDDGEEQDSARQTSIIDVFINSAEVKQFEEKVVSANV